MRHVYVPQYPNLSLGKISSFLNDGRKHVFDYLPEPREITKVARDYICDVCASLLGKEFTDWVKKRVDKRNATVIEKRDLNIDIDDEVLEAFNNSTAVSSKSIAPSRFLTFHLQKYIEVSASTCSRLASREEEL